MHYRLKTALEHRTILGEGPVWDEKNERLFYIDSLDNKVCIFYPATKEHKVYDVGQNVGTVVLTEKDNEVVVGLVDGIYMLHLASSKLDKKAEPEKDITGNRLNDGKADKLGRIWIGSMCVDDNGVEGFDTSFKCNLHRVNTDYSCSVVDASVRLANGMAWTQDNKTMYFIDSPARCVYEYDFDLEKGEIENKRVCISIPENLGVGDGMDIDADGNLWIAHWMGWCVGKWDPRTGEMLGKIDIPVARVASCAFGGPNYEQLYIVTASVNTEKDEIAQPQAGYIFLADELSTKGIPFNRFKG